MAAFALAASVVVASVSSATAAPAPKPSGVVPVLFVGNNWDGTADVIRQGGTASAADVRRAWRGSTSFPTSRSGWSRSPPTPCGSATSSPSAQLIGEGHDQFVDDMFASKDGRLLVVSRPSLADVVALDLNTGAIVWRFRVAGQRSDHMAMSPDGTRVAVSASTGNVVHILDTFTGQEVGQFASGDSPHENNYSADGQRIFHASIGLVYTPADQPQLDTTKGDRRFQIVDANTNQIIKQIDMGQKLAEAGYPNMSSAVRPMALSPDETKVYFQVSFFHGFVEYDFAQDRVTRVANLPNEVPNMPREEYLLDSAHHGIAMNPEGTRLCVAGTMSDYAAIVERSTFQYTLIHGGTKPYWSTNSADGRYCFVSWSGDDKISAISYKSKARWPRSRSGTTRSGCGSATSPAAGCRRGSRRGLGRSGSVPFYGVRGRRGAAARRLPGIQRAAASRPSSSGLRPNSSSATAKAPPTGRRPATASRGSRSCSTPIWRRSMRSAWSPRSSSTAGTRSSSPCTSGYAARAAGPRSWATSPTSGPCAGETPFRLMIFGDKESALRALDAEGSL